MKKVLIAPATLAGRTEGAFIDILKSGGFELVFPKVKRQMLEPEIKEELQGICASLAGSEPYTQDVLQANPQLRVIARMGVGYDAVDVATATSMQIPVTITPGANQDAVAEHTFALMLGVTKNLINQHIGTKNGNWPRSTTIPLRKQTLGIVGLGRIGKAIVERAIAFKMNVIAFEPYPDETFVKSNNIKLVTLEDLYRQADFVSLHIPLTPESKHMINKNTLALMKPTAYLINTARGGLVCETDLIDALQNGKIAGAGLDVFEEEPPPPSPLLELPNVVLTPHAAGVDLQSREDMAASAAQAIVDFSQGKWPAEKIVNGSFKETYKFV